MVFNDVNESVSTGADDFGKKTESVGVGLKGKSTSMAHFTVSEAMMCRQDKPPLAKHPKLRLKYLQCLLGRQKSE